METVGVLVLSPKEIMERHRLSRSKYERIEDQVKRNVLFHFPNGSQRDIAMFVLASSREGIAERSTIYGEMFARPGELQQSIFAQR